jgi:tRNA pseudouridine38-40 synthase
MPVNEPGPPETVDRFDLIRASAGLIRVRLDLAYDGTEFVGWARQPDQRTVQSVVEDALMMILRVPSASLTVAGRTDAGVHATGQVTHVDVPLTLWTELGPSLLRRLAGVLPRDVRVTAVSEALPGFDARFSALHRRYVYRATDAPWGVDPLRRLDTLAWSRPLDVGAMATAAEALLGERDFSAYCRRRQGATSIRTLQSLDVIRRGHDIEWWVQADAFCYSMVRSLVGALLAVGDGRQDPGWPASRLALRTRADDVTVAPARGLTLVGVAYPDAAELARRAKLTRRRRDGLVLPPLRRPQSRSAPA